MERFINMEINAEELQKKIQNGEKIMIDFWASFCGPCKIMKPNFEKVAQELSNKNSDIKLYTMSLDVDGNKDYAIKLGIMGIPAIRAFNNNKQIYSKVGLTSEEEIRNIVNSIFV